MSNIVKVMVMMYRIGVQSVVRMVIKQISGVTRILGAHLTAIIGKMITATVE